METYAEIESALERLVESHTQLGVSQSYVEVLDNGNETILGGNSEGLAFLALQLVRLAQKPAPGTHYHVDSTSADLVQRPLVMRLTAAPEGWKT